MGRVADDFAEQAGLLADEDVAGDNGGAPFEVDEGSTGEGDWEHDRMVAAGLIDNDDAEEAALFPSKEEFAAIEEAVERSTKPKPKTAGESWLQLRRVRTDGGTQSRVRLDPTIVQDYAQQFTQNSNVTGGKAADSAKLWWGNFPPLDVYLDGDYWLADGFHRLAGIEQALKSAGLPDYNIRNWQVLCRIHLGTRRDAILHAAGANANHGLRRTNADKRKVVETLLRDEEWRQWSDAEIARRCSVDGKTVANVRHALEVTLEIPESIVRKTASGREVNTEKIGARSEPQIEDFPMESNRLPRHGFSLQRLNGRWRYLWKRDSGTEVSEWRQFADEVYNDAWTMLEQLGIDRRQHKPRSPARAVYVEQTPKAEPPATESAEPDLPTITPGTFGNEWEAGDWRIRQLPGGKFYANCWPKDLLATDRFATMEEALAAAIAGETSRDLYGQWLHYNYLCTGEPRDPTFTDARNVAPLWMLREALEIAQTTHKRKSSIKALEARIRKLEREENVIVAPDADDLEQEADDLAAMDTPTPKADPEYVPYSQLLGGIRTWLTQLTEAGDSPVLALAILNKGGGTRSYLGSLEKHLQSTEIVYRESDLPRAIEEMYQWESRKQDASESSPPAPPTPAHKDSIIDPSWIVATLTAQIRADNADFVSALKMATREQLRAALANLSTEDSYVKERLEAIEARLRELAKAEASVAVHGAPVVEPTPIVATPTPEPTEPTLPDDLTAAGFRLVQPSPTGWAIVRRADGYESEWRIGDDIDLLIDEARLFVELEAEEAAAAVEPERDIIDDVLDAAAAGGIASVRQLDGIVGLLIDPELPTSSLAPYGLVDVVRQAADDQLVEALRLMPDGLRKGRGPVLEFALRKRGVKLEPPQETPVEPSPNVTLALVVTREAARQLHASLLVGALRYHFTAAVATEWGRVLEEGLAE